MYQLTTPPIEIMTDIDLTGMDDVELTIKDGQGTTVYVHSQDLTITSDKVSCRLTQQQTQKLHSGKISMQLRYIKDGIVPPPSNVIETTLKTILSQEVLGDV